MKIFKNFINLQHGEKYTHGLINLVSSTALGQLITIAALPILTRLYTPSEMGKFGLMTSFLSLVSVLSCLKYEVAIVAAKSYGDAVKLSILSLFISLISFILFGWLFIYFIKHNILGFAVLPIITAPVVALSLLAIALFQIAKFFNLRINNYKIIGYSNLTQNCVKVFSQVTLGLLKLESLGLILGDLLGRSMGIIGMMKIFHKEFKQHSYVFNVKALWKLAIKNRAYPLYIGPSSIINTLTFTLPIPLLTQYYGVSIAGIYLLANRILAFPISLISANIADIFYSQISDYSRENYSQIKPIFWLTAKKLLFMGLLPTIIIILFSSTVLGNILGKNWQEVGIITTFMAPWGLAQFIVSPISRVVLVVGGQKFKLIYDFFCLMNICGGFYGAAFFHLSPVTAIAIVSALQVCAYGVCFTILCFLINRFLKNKVIPKI